MERGEIVPNGSVTQMQRFVRRSDVRIAGQTYVAQRQLEAMGMVAESAAYQVVRLKRMQRELEQMAPEAAEVLNLIMYSASMQLAYRVQRFGGELG
jgi:hypothetical protein